MCSVVETCDLGVFMSLRHVQMRHVQQGNGISLMDVFTFPGAEVAGGYGTI